jgi:hypothetical protein
MSLRIAPLVAIWLVTAIHAFAALAVGKPEWGFDGTVTPGTFNILSLELRNTGAAAFDGDITLDDAGTFGSPSAAPYRQKIFLAPGTARWVQFHPYIGTGAVDWRLVWTEKGREAKENVSPEGGLKTGPPAIVMLADPEAPALRNARMRVFNEANFPPTAAATDALHAVVLDHQPRWESARREAFLHWVKRGGILHLLPGPDGTLPVFTEELSPLNTPGNVGAGRVIRHTLSRADITEKALAEAGFPAPEYKANTSAERNSTYEDSDGAYFDTLALVTKPNIAWWLIYLLTALYIGLIGPVFYFLRKRDYRALLAGFIATVALFAWLFTVVGRRGYGERQIYHSLAVARGIEAGKWDVLHFVHAFATSGDLYRLSYPGTAQLFAAPSRGGETVRGTIMQGKDAHLAADIPLFSARPFVHRGVMPGPDFSFTVSKFGKNAGGILDAITLTATGTLPEGIVKAAAQYKASFFSLTQTGNTFTSTGGHCAEISEVLGDGSRQRHYQNFRHGGNSLSAINAITTNFGALLAREVSDDANTPKLLPSRNPGADFVRLFLYTRAPAAFRMNTAAFDPGLEHVLYVLDLPIPK